MADVTEGVLFSQEQGVVVVQPQSVSLPGVFDDQLEARPTEEPPRINHAGVERLRRDRAARGRDV